MTRHFKKKDSFTHPRGLAVVVENVDAELSRDNTLEELNRDGFTIDGKPYIAVVVERKMPAYPIRIGEEIAIIVREPVKHDWMTINWEAPCDDSLKPIASKMRARCLCKVCGQPAWVYQDGREEMQDPAKVESSGVRELEWYG